MNWDSFWIGAAATVAVEGVLLALVFRVGALARARPRQPDDVFEGWKDH